MIAITIAELSKEILNKIEEMPCSKKYKDSLRCQGVKRIQQYFNDLGQDIFCPKLQELSHKFSRIVVLCGFFQKRIDL